MLLSDSNNMREIRTKTISSGNGTLKVIRKEFPTASKKIAHLIHIGYIRQRTIRSVCSDHPGKIFRPRGRVADLHSYRTSALLFYVALHILIMHASSPFPFHLSAASL